MDRSSRSRGTDDVPPGIKTECKRMAEDLRVETQAVRYDKILAARMRVASGYYNSGHVLRVIAARLLEGGVLTS